MRDAYTSRTTARSRTYRVPHHVYVYLAPVLDIPDTQRLPVDPTAYMKGRPRPDVATHEIQLQLVLGEGLVKRTDCKTETIKTGDGYNPLAKKYSMSDDDIMKYNSKDSCSTPTPGGIVCCLQGDHSDIAPKSEHNSTCVSVKIRCFNSCGNLGLGTRPYLNNQEKYAICDPTVLGAKPPTSDRLSVALTPAPSRPAAASVGSQRSSAILVFAPKMKTAKNFPDSAEHYAHYPFSDSYDHRILEDVHTDDDNQTLIWLTWSIARPPLTITNDPDPESLTGVTHPTATRTISPLP
ncbi:hypothetical protein F5B18DRAFT_652385 [Nemania serpens]|nr:hypothetical protein F5B18DRAFT_652385 [Nemania serpens]